MRRIMTRPFAAALAVLLTTGAPAAAAQGVRAEGPIAQDATSHIFSPIVLPGTAEDAAMQAAGYVQEEYFLSGEANIYGEAPDGKTSVRTTGVPYTTRLVILRPRDPGRFNGIVQLGFTHPQLASAQWGRLDGLVLGTGSVAAVVMIGGDEGTRTRSTPEWPVTSPKVFPWYEPARYGAIRWPEDDGIRWDVMGQTARLLRDPMAGGPLAGFAVRRVYMSGWSFLGSTIRSWINFGFHDRYRRADGSPVVDGYLIGISAASVKAGRTPLNSADPHKDRTREQLAVIDRPVIELTSEMEAITNIHLSRAEADTVAGGYRIYELGGVSHGDSGVPGQVRAAEIQLRARNHPAVTVPVNCAVVETDVPMRDVAQAALANLDRWVEEGVAPPRAARLQVAPGGKDYVRDDFGNPKGGIRVAQLDVPLVRYAEPAEPLCDGPVPRRKLRRLPVSADLLGRTYPGGAADYLARFRARTAELVAQRWLLPADAERQLRRAEIFAREAFATPAK